MSNTLVDVIIKDALAMVKRGHCRDAEARNRLGNPTSPLKVTAVAFSITGALMRAANAKSIEWIGPYCDAFHVFDDAARSKHGVSIHEFNDLVAESPEDFEALLDKR